MTVEQIREWCRESQLALSTEYYRAGAGLQETLDTVGLMGRWPQLSGLEAYRVVTAAELSAAAGSDEARLLRLLREHLASLFEAARAAALTDRLHAAEVAATIEVDGERLPYRASVAAVANEPDRARRCRLAQARYRVLDGFEPDYLEAHRVTRAAVAELGFAGQQDRCERLGGLPLAPLAAAMQGFLTASEGLYHEVLTELLAEQGIACDEAVASDLAWLFRLSDFDDAFAADTMAPRLQEMVESMGLDSTAEGNVTYDLAERPSKSPRAFCSVIDAPRRVILVTRPAGGLTDYMSFLHELGHALHFGYLSPALAWEYRHLGDNSVTEAFAFLFERLVLSPDWQQDVLANPRAEQACRVIACRGLMMNRKYAAQLAYELELWRSDQPATMASQYTAWLDPATGVTNPPENYLAAVDPEFYCARYLRGWLLEAQLSEHLHQTCGPRWWREPAAGRWLRELWSAGQRPTGDELAAAIGYDLLDYGPLLRRFERLLTGP